ncbi:putative B3 domain-containing protein At5g66980 [Aristolochia californica]|uniref:putative B3 domain-containing protein At5g66980 n=1 Tax=Aristolochia californica TaxID=171875 RepID=UPI0035E0883B
MAPCDAAAEDHKPSFVKIMFGDFAKRMRIPSSFNGHIKGKLKDRSVLTNANGRCWHVEIQKVGASWCFLNGWTKFVKDNSLQFADFLSFTYDGELNFEVMIFGKDGVEKEVPVQGYDELSTSVEDQQIAKEKRANSTRLCLCRYKKNRSIRRREDGNEQMKPVFKAHRSCPFNLNNPHSAVIYKSFRTNDIRLPKAFVRESGIGKEGTTPKVDLLDPKGKRWSMYMTQGGEGRWNFGNKWRECVMENNLVAGDVCAFELIGSKNQGSRNVLQVHIYRKGGKR